MRLIFLGPPGSGKGTQAKRLSQRLGLAHIATGDIFRDAIAAATPEGQLVQPYVAAGKLVPDEIVNAVVAARFRAADSPRDFILDGYPRTRGQAEALDAVLRERGLTPDVVIYLRVPDDEIVRRLAGRWSCPQCKTPYHATSKPPRTPGVCDECGQALTQREDDREDTVRRRLEVFHEVTQGLLQYYQERGLFREVAGQGTMEDIHQNILAVLEKKNDGPVPPRKSRPAPKKKPVRGAVKGKKKAGATNKKRNLAKARGSQSRR